MDLTHRIDAMWAKRGQDYRPRTRHMDSDGRPRYTNRLFLETSPYLLQHAHNPVDWYPWGDEAFETARRLDRPVLLSIGYATCHWCHVMEEESFEDEEIARTINAGYIAVKVDREERPDVDTIYMSAVQAITGRGGWPMTVWLTPAREPFYGGTYYPARDGDRGAPMGFLTILKKIRESYDHKRDVVSRSARELSRSIEGMLVPAAGDHVPGDDVIGRAVAASKARFDARHGGVAGAPKFPSSLPVRLLLRRYHRTGDRDCLNMANLTLVRMADGGIYDQVGGGFHRYSTDDAWLVPHFEKMLYDNALLVPAYLDGWQISGDPRFAEVVRSTLNYVAREMTAPCGGFYSAGDADSLTPSGHREEGYFFTWTPGELEAALGPADAKIAARAFGITQRGNFEGRNVLHQPMHLDALAAALGRPQSEVKGRLQHIRQVLYDYRCRRPAPLVDDKLLVAWNGLMISAFARAGFVLDDVGYIERARNAAVFILDAMVAKGRLKRSFKAAVASGNGFLEDHAFLTAALLELFSVTASEYWLASAVDLDRVLADHFEDTENGGFFMTADDHETLIAREKPFMDGALPSGNAVTAMNLLRLNQLTLDESYHRRAEKIFHAFSSLIETTPLAFGEMLLALDDFLHPPRRVTVILGESHGDPSLADHLRRSFLPGSQVLVATQTRAADLSAAAAAFQNKTAMDGKTTVYVCRQDACEPPATNVAALKRQLDR